MTLQRWRTGLVVWALVSVSACASRTDPSSKAQAPTDGLAAAWPDVVSVVRQRGAEASTADHGGTFDVNFTRFDLNMLRRALPGMLGSRATAALEAPGREVTVQSGGRVPPGTVAELAAAAHALEGLRLDDLSTWAATPAWPEVAARGLVVLLPPPDGATASAPEVEVPLEGELRDFTLLFTRVTGRPVVFTERGQPKVSIHREGTLSGAEVARWWEQLDGDEIVAFEAGGYTLLALPAPRP